MANFAPDLDDMLHYIKKIKFSLNTEANVVNTIFASGIVCVKLSSSHPTARLEEKAVVYNEVLSLMEEAEQQFMISEAVTHMSWLVYVWAGIKAFIYHHLGLQQPQDPVSILTKLTSAYKEDFSTGRVALIIVVVFILKVIIKFLRILRIALDNSKI